HPGRAKPLADPRLPVVQVADGMVIEEDIPGLRGRDAALDLLEQLDQLADPAIAVVGVGVADEQIVVVLEGRGHGVIPGTLTGEGRPAGQGVRAAAAGGGASRPTGESPGPSPEGPD